MVDRDLVELARQGDREAFALLVHQVSDSLYAVAQRILRDSGLAEDMEPDGGNAVAINRPALTFDNDGYGFYGALQPTP